MKFSFSTLACPEAGLAEVLKLATASRYDGVELRFVEGEDSLWKLPVFSGGQRAATRRMFQDAGVTIACVDTSCHFHSPDAAERERNLEEGVRMAELAAGLAAPGIRIFGDKVQKGATRDQTRQWIAESMWKLAEKTRQRQVEVWIESHGDFATSHETAAILKTAGCHDIGAVWDPANCFIEVAEKPADGGPVLGAAIRHVHIKDLALEGKSWEPALPGQGTFPMRDVLSALRTLHFNGYVSFEWEKKWHPAIPVAAIAVPRFAEWFRSNQAA